MAHFLTLLKAKSTGNKGLNFLISDEDESTTGYAGAGAMGAQIDSGTQNANMNRWHIGAGAPKEACFFDSALGDRLQSRSLNPRCTKPKSTNGTD